VFFKVNCPECLRNAEVVDLKRRKGKKKYVLFCKFCENKWEEELITSRKDDDSVDLDIDAMLLGIEIFEVAHACLSSLDCVSEKKPHKGCFKIIKYFQSLLSETESEPEKLKEIIIEHRKNNVWVDYKIKDFVENSTGDKRKNECLSALEYLQSLLSEIEDSWGLPRMKKMLIEHKKNIDWAVKELKEFAEESEGRMSKKAEKIVRYLEAVSDERVSY
jgi:hypothetical protein